MQKKLTEKFFKDFMTKMIFTEAYDDYVFDGLVDCDASMVEDLLSTYLKKQGVESPYRENDFVVGYTIDPDFVAIRILIKNEVHSTIRKFYVVFRLYNQAAIDRACYLTQTDVTGRLVCGRVNADGTYHWFEDAIFDDDDETQVIFSDYVKNHYRNC